MKKLIEFHGFIQEKANKSIRATSFSVGAPFLSSIPDAYACLVQCTEIGGRELEIYGADSTQAKKLALYLLKEILGDYILLDLNKQPISIDWEKL